MKKLKYIGILFLLILFSCVDDESRYGDIDIDEIKIEGIKDYQEIEVGGKLTIAPVVTTKFGEKSDLSYVWYKYNEEQSVADTLSFEKNLDVVISDVLPGVKTTLKFKVTDNKTGLYVIEESSFTTIGKYSGGTLMLCKTGGEYDLTMLKKDGTTLYEKIYTQINEGEKLSEQSRKIILIKPYARNPRPYKAVVVTAKNNTGGVYLDPDLFVRKAYMKEKFFSGEDLTGDIGIDGYCTDQGSDYLVVNGKVHGRAYGFEETAVWNPEIVFLSAPQDYSAASYVAQPTGYLFGSFCEKRIVPDRRNESFSSEYCSKSFSDNPDYGRYRVGTLDCRNDNEYRIVAEGADDSAFCRPESRIFYDSSHLFQ